MMLWLEAIALSITRLIGLTAFMLLQGIERRLKELPIKPNTTNRLSVMIGDLKRRYAIIEFKEKPVDLMPAQIEMENLFHKNQLHRRIKKEFTDSEINFREFFEEIGINQNFGFDLLVQMVLHKRANIKTLVGLLRKHYAGDCQATTEALHVAALADLIDWDDRTEVFILKMDITPDVQREIDIYQYPMPLVVEPKEIKHNRESGYYTHNDSVILRNNHHEDDVCLDYLNKINRVKLRVNTDTVAFLHNKWRNLDRPKEGEDRAEFNKRLKAFQKYDDTAKDVFAHLECTGGEFYLTHRYDKRGRVYCQGYHCTYQGNDWNKATIEFAHGEPIE